MPFAELTYDRCAKGPNKMRPPKTQMRPQKPDPSYVWDRCEKKWRPKKRIGGRRPPNETGNPNAVFDRKTREWRNPKKQKREKKPDGDVVWRNGSWQPRKRPYKPRPRKKKTQ